MAARGLFTSERSYRTALPVLVLLYLLIQIPAARDLLILGTGLTPDDAMRLVEVRDLLSGQAWYDLFQHRVLPPDGLSMHWSRYIDAPMAAIMAVLEPVMGLDMAGRVLAILWPLSMGLIFIALTARLTRQLYGYQAAFLSALVISYYELLAGSGFGVGATDHHSAQINLILGMFALLVLPGNALRRGAAAGALAALSLAIGLEMIFAVALAGLSLVGAFILSREGAAPRLLGFATALALASPLLMAGQLSPALWSVPVCDALSPPLLAVTTAAFLCSAALVTAGRWLPAPAARLGLTLALGALAALALYPAIRPCLAGPYTALSPEIQRTVLAQIEEVKPAGPYFIHDIGRAIVLMAPFYLMTALFAGAVIQQRGRNLILLVLLVMASVLSFWQMRMMNMGLPLIALAFGAGGSWALMHENRRIKLAGTLTLLAIILSKPLGIAYITATWNGPGPVQGQTAQSAGCAAIDKLATLNDAPAGIVFNQINLGPLVLLSTHHSITSAPYHRSADAFANGILPFTGDASALRLAVDRTGADYILLCKGDVTGTPDSIGSQLAAGTTLPWLAEVPLRDPDLRLLKVLR